MDIEIKLNSPTYLPDDWCNAYYRGKPIVSNVSVERNRGEIFRFEMDKTEELEKMDTHE